MKPRFKLRLVKPERPLGPLSRAEKVARAKAYLQRKGEFARLGASIYVFDRGTPKPKWGVPGEPAIRTQKVSYRAQSSFFERVADFIKVIGGQS